MSIWAQLSGAMWNPWLFIAFFLVGGYFSIRTGFFQLFGAGQWLGETLSPLLRRGRKRGEGGKLSQFQAMATALGSTVGTSSIAGVSTAIYFGGAGAVFWMWASAFLGMMTGYAEKALTIRYRCRNAAGAWEGGPMDYMRRGLHSKALARAFCAACLLASFCGGNLVQANSIAGAVGVSFGISPLLTGLVVAAVTGVVIFGGISRIGAVSSALVPFMALLFVGGGLWVLFVHASAIAPAMREIFVGAFSPAALAGGGAGYGVSQALRYGVARGVFTNEAGMGSSAMAHAVAETESEHTQGLWGMLEVFLATMVIATISALVILTSGAYQPAEALRGIETGLHNPDMLGVSLVVSSFGRVMGEGSGVFITLCLSLFAVSTLLGWSYYGERCLAELTGGQGLRGVYRLAFIGLILLGSISKVDVVWEIADLCNGLMALPNLLALLFLSPQVIKIWKQAQGIREGAGQKNKG